MKESQVNLLRKRLVVKFAAEFSRLSAVAVTIGPCALTLSAAILTVFVARMISFRNPLIHWEPQPGLHVHHYTFGIFALAVAGYAALVFKGPRASFWIALLYGFGLGLVFDEFGLWLHLQDEPTLRWNRTGLMMVAGIFFTGIAWTYFLKWNSRSPDEGPVSAAPVDTETVAD